jgi:hypothetical protein
MGHPLGSRFCRCSHAYAFKKRKRERRATEASKKISARGVHEEKRRYYFKSMGLKQSKNQE